VVQLKALKLDKNEFDQLAQVLRQTDFVKFAKFIPSADDDKRAFETIYRSIQKIEQKPDAVRLA
jgi:hypothetical protein